MKPRGDRRRLAAILATDIVGYSLLMGADESGTLARLNTHRAELIDPVIEKNHGRVIKTTGDGMLVEFASVVDAVACAAEIQRRMARRNEDVPEAQRVRYRMGVELGDVIVEGDDIYGDGVNIAARLEALAKPGEICISAKVHEEVKTRLELDFEDLGERRLKNIAQPVRTYRVVPGADAPARIRRRGGAWRWVAAAAVVVALLLAAGGGYWAWDNSWRFQRVEAASVERMAFPLPAKPSIAVLPFVNLSVDPADGFLPDGISEDITASLSKLPKLFVISRTTTATYKDRDVTVKQVAEELGVRYVLEGSVQRQGERMRVTAQLIDALSGAHVWAGRYDRDMTDLFAVKDEITLNVVSNVGAELELGEYDRRLRSETDSLEAWLLHREGRQLMLHLVREDNLLARDRFERAIAIDPDFLSPYTLLANTFRFDARFGWTDAREETFDKALEMLNQVLEKDPTHALTYSILAFYYRDRGLSDLAIEAAAKAVELDANDFVSHGALGSALLFDGRPSEAIPEYKAAMRLSPVYPDWALDLLSDSYVLSGDLDPALQSLETHLARPLSSPSWEARARARLAVVYDAMGREQEARDQVARAVEVRPQASISWLKSAIPTRTPPRWTVGPKPGAGWGCRSEWPQGARVWRLRSWSQSLGPMALMLRQAQYEGLTQFEA